MTYNYNNLRAQATKQINKFGTIATISRTTKGVRNPATGKTEGDITITAIKNCVVQSWSSDELVGGVIKSSSKKLLIDPEIDKTLTPQTGDIVKVQGTEYKIGKVIPEQPGNLVLLYTCEGQV